MEIIFLNKSKAKYRNGENHLIVNNFERHANAPFT